MKPASLKEIKTELNNYPKADLEALCLRLTKYKKENKELLSYLLFESSNEEEFIRKVKGQIDTEFNKINLSSLFLAKKTIRKVLRTTQKHIRFSGIKRTEVELLMYFCLKVKKSGIDLQKSKAMKNLYDRQVEKINKALSSLHEDLQYDYRMEMEEMEIF